MALHDYGPVTAYAWAVENGHFTGTLAEWVEMIGNVSDNAAAAVSAKSDAITAKNAAISARTAAQTASSDAEAWAKGTRGGTVVESTDPAYHANAAYHAEQAAASAALAAASELVCTAEAGAGHAPAIRTTASGPIAHFEDAAVAPMALDIAINPVQEAGEITPSTPRAITGHTSVTVSRSGADTSDADEYEITLPSGAGMVYGGILHINQDGSGVLTVDRAIVDFSDLTWKYGTWNDYPLFSTNDLRSPAIWRGTGADMPNLECSHYPKCTRSYLYANNVTGICFANNGNAPDVMIRDARYTDKDTFTAAVSGVKLVYELKTPTAYTFTAQQISSLLGENNVWADTGDVTAEYTADTKAYIERLTQPDADWIADAGISSGEYFMVGNELYIATDGIAAGETIVPGTNCTKKSLAEALNAINA